MEASSFILMSSELVCRRELAAPILTLMELKSTSRKRSSASMQKSLKPVAYFASKRSVNCFGSFELHNNVLFGFLKKGAQLIIFLLKMVKTSVLFDNVNLELFNEVS